ncbi:MAG: hydantoinase/oxoprolinase family protein [Candidatus Tectomicrobia bacterium]|nr:hydantoinase/oxoprolinase family protein [Candidatus Tectomicrobia bacterium]
MHIATDIGGTFTDVAAYDPASGRLLLGKWSTTPRQLTEGLFTAIGDSGAALREADLLIHGSTLVVNAILEQRGAKTALITTKGFRDIYEIGRINRPESFNLFFRKHVPLIPRYLRFELNERLNAQGEVLIPFDEAEARELARRIVRQGVEAVAVLFLHSYCNPEHEARMKAILEEEAPHLYVSASHELSREYYEYERTSTVAANAYVGPMVRAYLRDLEARGSREGLRGRVMIVQSNGGLVDTTTATTACIGMLESGPAAGVSGANALGRSLGLENLICFDMGGTTAKACVIEGGLPRMASDYFLGGYTSGLAIRIPSMDIHEVGMGGGSIARLEGGRLLHVGPQSAGADPGPVCYGRGGREPTVTDANVILNRLDPRRFLGGAMPLDAAAARRALRERVAHPLGLNVERAAQGIIEIASAGMANAVRAATTQRGLDPRDFTLVAYGGAGPLHVSAVARELHIPRVLVPQAPGHFSALGMLLADLRYDAVRTFLTPLSDGRWAEVEKIYQELAAECVEVLRRGTTPTESLSVLRFADMRYVGQQYTVLVPIPGDLTLAAAQAEVKRRLDAVHEQRFSHSAPAEPAEFVTLRVSVSGAIPRPTLPLLPLGDPEPPAAALRGRRGIVFADSVEPLESPVYAREALLAGNCVTGPAVIEEPASTTLLFAGDRAVVNEVGLLLIEVAQG